MIPVFTPLISKKDKKSVLSTLNKGEISGNFGDTIKNLNLILQDTLAANMLQLHPVEQRLFKWQYPL